MKASEFDKKFDDGEDIIMGGREAGNPDSSNLGGKRRGVFKHRDF